MDYAYVYNTIIYKKKFTYLKIGEAGPFFQAYTHSNGT
jgi:hypothetical protein